MQTSQHSPVLRPSKQRVALFKISKHTTVKCYVEYNEIYSLPPEPDTTFL